MKNELMVFEHKEHAVVGSRAIADRFEKSHPEILKTINGENRGGKHTPGLLDGIRSSVKTPDLYFIKSWYQDSYGRNQPEYLCTRDGFSLLAMGFSGQKALEWKIKYIKVFNAMEEFIKERQSSEWLMTRKQGKLVRRTETDTLANLIEYAIKQGSKTYLQFPQRCYQNYSNMVNGLVGIEKDQRDLVPFKVISTIMFLEDMVLHTVDEEMQKGTHYKQIYQICKANGMQIMKFAYLPVSTYLPQKAG